MDTLHVHTIHLYDGPLTLRPMTEADWDVLHLPQPPGGKAHAVHDLILSHGIYEQRGTCMESA